MLPPNNPFTPKRRLLIPKNPRVEFYQDIKKEWRWRLFYSSDEVAASSEGYKNKAEAKDNFLKIEQHIKWLRENNGI